MQKLIKLRFSDHKNAATYTCENYVVKRDPDGTLRTHMFGSITIDGKPWTFRGGKRYDRKGLPTTII